MNVQTSTAFRLLKRLTYGLLALPVFLGAAMLAGLVVLTTWIIDGDD